MIEFKNVSFGYDNIQILKDFHITFDDKKITCLLGPSGVGKTTLVNMVATLIKPQKGCIMGIENLRYSYVFQEPRLLDWYNVYQNIELVLKDVYDAQKRKNIINSYIDMVGLTNYKDYKPPSLSGGMAQRVSIARAFAYPSNVLIMDEPFKGLDVKLKYEMISLFKKLWLESKRTVIFITHDMDEAISLSHTIYMLKNRPIEIVKKYDTYKENNDSLLKKRLEEIYFS